MNKLETAIKNGVHWHNKINPSSKIIPYNEPNAQSTLVYSQSHKVSGTSGVGIIMATAAAAEVAVAAPITAATGGFFATFTGAVSAALAAVPVLAKEIVEAKNGIQTIKDAISGKTQEITEDVKQVYQNNKTPIIIGSALLVTLGAIKLYQNQNKKK
jgi:hypothetical protein